MTQQKISQLPSAAPLSGAELMEVVQLGNSRKANVARVNQTNFISNTNTRLEANENTLSLDISGSEVMDISSNDAGDVIMSLSGASGPARDLVLDCGLDKTLELKRTVWDDLRIVPSQFDVIFGTNDPELEDWQPGGSGTTYQVYKFQLDDQGFFTVQIPHTYKLGTDLYPHIHWTPCDRGNEESGNLVGWKLDYSIAQIGENFPSSSTVDLSDACSGVDDRHEITSQPAIDGSGITGVSAMLVCRVYRSDTGSDDTWVGTTSAQSPALLEIDFHFEIDTVGSRQIIVK